MSNRKKFSFLEGTINLWNGKAVNGSLLSIPLRYRAAQVCATFFSSQRSAKDAHLVTRRALRPEGKPVILSNLARCSFDEESGLSVHTALPLDLRAR